MGILLMIKILHHQYVLYYHTCVSLRWSKDAILAADPFPGLQGQKRLSSKSGQPPKDASIALLGPRTQIIRGYIQNTRFLRFL